MARSEKEAIIIVLDVGQNSLGRSGKDATFFERAKKCASKIISRKIFTKPKDEIGLILMGTEDTENELNTTLGGYENIVEKIKLSTTSFKMLRVLDEIEPNENENADWLDALIVAMNFLKTEGQAKKLTSSKIILLTNFHAAVNNDKVDTIIDGLKQMQVKLLTFSDDVRYFNNEEFLGTFSQSQTKSQQQIESENLFARVVNETNGYLCHMDYVEVEQLHFQKKSAKPMPWNCMLTIGSNLQIAISAYVRVQEEKFLGSFKTECSLPNTVTKVVTEHTLGNKPFEMDYEEISKAYMYGATVVNYPEAEESRYRNTDKCFSCLGFVSRKSILDEYLAGDSSYVVVAQAGSGSEQIISCLIKVMAETKSCMIVRRVYRSGSSPKLNVLLPNYQETIPYFTMIELPFAEDCISFQFPPLSSKKTQPTQEQYDAVEKLIDSMDLMTALDDDSGFSEAFTSQKTINPIHQHMCQSIVHRALYPTEKLNSIAQELLKLIDIPEKIKEASQPILEEIKGLFNLEIVKEPVKKMMPSTTNATTIDINGVQVDVTEADLIDDLGERNDTQVVGTVTPAEDFAWLIKKGEKFTKICEQIQDVIADLIFCTVNLQLEKVSGSILIYREEAKLLGPYKYNEWIVKLKDSLMNRNRIDFWEDVIVKENYGLITEQESNLSSVNEEQAVEFYKITVKATADEPMQADDDDELDNLLAD